MEEIEIKEKNIWQNSKMFTAVLITYMAVLLLFSGIRVVSGLGWLDSLDDEVVDVGFSIVSQFLIMLAVPLIAMMFVSKKSFKKVAGDFGFGKTSWKVIGFAFLLGILIYFLNTIVATFSSVILIMFGYRFPMGGSSFDVGLEGLLISIVLIGVLPGLCEESCHRGMLLQSFRSRFGVIRAAMITSLLFGLMHLNVVQVFFAAILGYLIALAVIATRSIWTGVIMHFCNNAINVYLGMAGENKWFLYNILDPLYSLFSGPFGLFIMIGFGYFMYWLIMRIVHMFAKENYLKNEKVYLARFMQANPNFIKQRVDRGESIAIEDMVVTVRQYVEGLNKGQATKFYLDDQRPKQAMSVIEKTLLAGVIFFGSLVTAFTFVWGML